MNGISKIYLHELTTAGDLREFVRELNAYLTNDKRHITLISIVHVEQTDFLFVVTEPIMDNVAEVSRDDIDSICRSLGIQSQSL